MDNQAKKKWAMRQRNFSEKDWWSVSPVLSTGKHRLHRGTPITDDLDDSTACRAFVRSLHESTAIADRIREAIADAPPKLVMLALSDLLQEHLTHLVMVEPDKEQTLLSKMLFSN